MRKRNKESNKRGCLKNFFSSCLSKIIEWIICLCILFGMFYHLGIYEKINIFLESHNVLEILSNKIGEKNVLELEPREVVDYYFECIRNGKNEEANRLFSADCDFQICTIEEYNKIITDIYYGFDKDIPTYPLFEEVRKFNYRIIDSGEKENQELAEVNIEIENCDIALIFGLILTADSNSLEMLSDSDAQELFRNVIAQYKDVCMISTIARFELKRIEDDGWKIQRISPLKDFSTVIIGQADDLILAINGENVENGFWETYEDSVDLYEKFEEDPYADGFLY